MRDSRKAPRVHGQMDRLFAEASTMLQRGLLGEAAERCLAILRKDPRHFDALQLIGVICSQQGRHDLAATYLERAALANPRSAEVLNNLGLALHLAARYSDAVAAYERAIVLRPNYPIALNNLGNSLGSLGRQTDAVVALERAVALDSNYAEAFNNLGTTFMALGRPQDAIAPLERALALRPRLSEANLNLGNAYSALKRYNKALAHHKSYFEAALAKSPKDAALHVSFARILQSSGDHDAAIKHYRKACALQSGKAAYHAYLGSAYQEIGQIAEAQRSFEAAIVAEPLHTPAYLALASLGRTAPGDPYLARLESLANDLPGFDAPDRVNLHFALGRSLNDIGEHQRAFENFVAGNALHRQRLTYDEADILGRLESIRSTFTTDRIRSATGGLVTSTPIFIVGMPRSGSTLVEQVLASHRDIFGAGEISEFGDTMRKVRAETAEQSFSEGIPTQFRELGGAYMESLEALAQGARHNPAPLRIVDKTLANFWYVGLIHMALPSARIIHTRRDPMDTCLSCFSTKFDTQPFTFDLGELGRYYRAYSETMAHWHRVLPPGVILDVQYEKLVTDFEPEARRMIAHCGLEWDDACLSPHLANRPVKTASLAQVRRPVSRSAIGRWRPDDDMLRPLIDAIGQNHD